MITLLFRVLLYRKLPYVICCLGCFVVLGAFISQVSFGAFGNYVALGTWLQLVLLHGGCFRCFLSLDAFLRSFLAIPLVPTDVTLSWVSVFCVISYGNIPDVFPHRVFPWMLWCLIYFSLTKLMFYYLVNFHKTTCLWRLHMTRYFFAEGDFLCKFVYLWPYWIIRFFSFYMPNSSIWAIDRTLSGATTLVQSRSGIDCNEGVLTIPQSLTFMSHQWFYIYIYIYIAISVFNIKCIYCIKGNPVYSGNNEKVCILILFNILSGHIYLIFIVVP